jgi:hypothetical protein
VVRVLCHEFQSSPSRGRATGVSAAKIPAANGHGTASAPAGNLDGVYVLSPELIDRAGTEQALGKDLILPVVSRLGLGFQISPTDERLGPNFGSWGAPGLEAPMARPAPKAA